MKSSCPPEKRKKEKLQWTNNQSQTTATSPALQPRKQTQFRANFPCSLPPSTIPHIPSPSYSCLAPWQSQVVAGRRSDRRLAFLQFSRAVMEEVASRLTLRNTALWLHAQHSYLKGTPWVQGEVPSNSSLLHYQNFWTFHLPFYFPKKHNVQKQVSARFICETKTSPAYILQGSEDFNVNSSRKCWVS